MIEINIDNYLSEDDKKELCAEYVREVLRGDEHHRERVLSNMAYSAAFAIIDSELTPDMLHTIRRNLRRAIQEPSNFGIFRKKDVWGEEDSPAYLEVKKAVEEHKHLIGPLVKKAIIARDYLKDLPSASECVAEMILDAIRRGITEKE